MKLIHRWRGPKREYDIATAIQAECESDADGSVERASYTACNVAEKLGALVALLHDRKVLNDAEVLTLVGSFDIAP